MLQIKNISKTYKTGDLVQTALDNVSLNLRDNEFVAILGPSGSGKTTLLNIIGGLDRYDSGDLIINNVSTKNYKDRDWDTYRNHTIGFVFQSYNLIPHQTVLSNVELALTIGGISKKQRKLRALEALDKVGLKDQAHKKPNQMSGGQMQRVAIARALVNNPSIVLADEPTGALDTKTSIQVMDLLKEVAKDRLVVMVTHNPDLANEYANRIIRLQDGEILSDSNPLQLPETKLKKRADKVKRARMSIFTALSLSFNNLLTKKGRTILTAFAGSIGIIGIALILSLSQGFQNYIDKIQEDTLSSYPLTITSETADTTSAILSMVTDHIENKAEGENLIERQYLTTMFSSIGTNDLKTFKRYVEYHQDEVDENVSEIRYSYSVQPQIYTIDAADNLTRLNPSSILSSMYSSSSLSLMSTMSAGGGGIFSEMTDDIDSIKDNYDVLKGRWPENFNELIIVLPDPNSISDLLVYALGMRDTTELKTIITDVMTGEVSSIENEPLKLTYDDLLNLDLKLIKSTDTYKYNDKYSIYEDMKDDDDYMRKLYNDSLSLKVVGIMSPKKGDDAAALSAGVCYTKALTKYVINEAYETQIVKSQLYNKDVDVFSGKRFDVVNEEDEEDSKLDFEDMISVDEDMIKEAFQFNVDTDSLDFESSLSNLPDLMDSSSATAAQMAANIPTTFAGINSGIMSSLVTMYELNPLVHNADKLLINNETLAATTSQFTKEKYKDALNMIISMGGDDTKEMKKLLDLLSDNDYEKLTASVVDMVEAYYGKVMLDPAYEESLIPYNNDDPTSIIYGSTKQSDCINAALLDTDSNTNILAGTQNISKTIIMGQMYIAMSPMMEAMQGLGDMFGEDMMSVDTDKFAQAFKFDMDQDELSRIMEQMMTGTQEKTYSSNLINLGYQNEDDPTNISFYFKDFESKENFLAFLDKYNETHNEDEKLSYTDITGLLMSSVKTIVDSVTYVLIAFVSISLVVSSIMIAVITLISVMERTKEIGILRAMGASKHNVSSIFNAETFIIGLLSGLLGVGVTFALIPPINSLIHNVTGNYDINAVLPTNYAIILVIISVVLTIFAGIIPSRKASKQDPVIALRTE